MTKVKILSTVYSDMLERMINEVIEKHEVTEIQYSIAGVATITYSAMITYEED